MTKTTIHVMTQQHPRWEATIRCAETCSWRAGPQLADKMRRRDFTENERVLCAEIGGWEKIYLMSGEIGLYEKYGFVKLGDYRTVYGSTDQLFVRDTREE